MFLSVRRSPVASASCAQGSAAAAPRAASRLRRGVMADRRSPGKARSWLPGATAISRIASATGSLVLSAAGTVGSYLGYEDLKVVQAGPEGGEDDGKPDMFEGQEEERKAWWPRLRDYMGKDIMSLMSVPVFIMEPTSVLQKMAEIMEYSELLDKAAECEDPELRLVYVACFAVGAYPSAERTYKPFNPILGETFELQKDGMRYIAEQVSHHPPVGAGHATGRGWEYDITSAPRTKFLGNSIDVYPVGRTRIRLRGEVYAIHPPQSRVNNILVGRTWVDHFGELTVEALGSGLVCDLVFTECGWFGAGRYGVSGTLFGPDDTPRLALEGAWNKGLAYARCAPDGGVADDAAWTDVWSATPPLAGDAFGFTAFAHALNGAATAPADMLPSDSRLRPDRQALQASERGRAGAAKHELEELQRAERRRREEEGVEWAPRWFRVATGADNNEEVDTDIWEFTGAYAQRAAPPDSAPPPDMDAARFSPWQFEKAA